MVFPSIPILNRIFGYGRTADQSTDDTEQYLHPEQISPEPGDYQEVPAIPSANAPNIDTPLDDENNAGVGSTSGSPELNDPELLQVYYSLQSKENSQDNVQIEPSKKHKRFKEVQTLKKIGDDIRNIIWELDRNKFHPKTMQKTPSAANVIDGSLLKKDASKIDIYDLHQFIAEGLDFIYDLVANIKVKATNTSSSENLRYKQLPPKHKSNKAEGIKILEEKIDNLCDGPLSSLLAKRHPIFKEADFKKNTEIWFRATFLNLRRPEKGTPKNLVYLRAKVSTIMNALKNPGYYAKLVHDNPKKHFIEIRNESPSKDPSQRRNLDGRNSKTRARC